jgi:hypothetical protein
VLPSRAARLERFAQVGDVALQHVGSGLRRRVPPELVDQTVDRHDFVRPQQEQCEDGPLLRTAERQERPVGSDLERAQDAKIELVREPTVARGSTQDKWLRKGEVRGRSRPPRTSRGYDERKGGGWPPFFRGVREFAC